MPQGKSLIVFYSRSGNTRTLAGYIQALTGADMVELVPQQAYPEAYRACTDQAKKELAADVRPPLKTTIENISDYELIYVGSPNWWGTWAGPVRTFLSQYALSGKRLAPFMTHGGSALGHGLDDMCTLSPGAVVLEGLAVSGNRVDSARESTAAWLKRLAAK